MRKLDKDQNRLVAKRYSGNAAIEVLLAKKTAGFVSSEIVRDAEDLALYGLRAGQIQRLTSLPGCSCRGLVEKVGVANWTGRPRNSLRKIIHTAVLQASFGAFINIIEQQLKLTESSKIVSAHILAAIRIFGLRFSAHRETVDWERMVHAALAFEDGKLEMINCTFCATRHISITTDQSDQKCPLCRVASSLTVIGGRVNKVTQYLREEKPKIPATSGSPGQRRARFHVALSGVSNF